MNTENYLKHLKDSYPEMDIQDICKALYQSCYGSGHFVNSFSSCQERIEKEYQETDRKEKELLTQLDGPYVRLDLSIIDRGLATSTLARMFMLSAKEDQCATARLEEKLEILIRMIHEGFMEEKSLGFIDSWKMEGYPSLHHSEKYRRLYAPHYRLIQKEMVPLLPVLIAMDQKRKLKDKITIAIDGHCGAGKTTCGVILKRIYDSNLIHVDDFYLQKQQRTPERYSQPGGNFDRERLEKEVLIPIAENKEIRYQWFDCSDFTLKDFITLPLKKINIIEGSYSMYPSLQKYYDLSVFVDIDPELQLKRIERRNPDKIQDFRDRWIPLENRYFEAFDIRSACDIIIENS